MCEKISASAAEGIEVGDLRFVMGESPEASIQ